MKLHLPKVLLTAIVSLMSAAAYGTTSANVADVTDTIKNDETILAPENVEDETRAFVPIYAGGDLDQLKSHLIAATGSFDRPVIFDPETVGVNAIIESWGTEDNKITLNAPLYVREEVLTLKNCHVKTNAGGTAIVDQFHISGNNGTLILDNSTFTITLPSGSSYSVDTIGGKDGAGTVKLQNGSTLSYQNWLTIGGHKRGSSTATYGVASAVSPSDPTRYQGGMYTESNGEVCKNNMSNLHYGTGTLEVVGGSVINGRGGITASNANILVSGKGSTVNTNLNGLDKKHKVDDTGYEEWIDTIGRHSSSTTTLRIEDGGVWNCGSCFYTSFADAFEMRAHITIDGDDSELNVAYILGLGYGGKFDYCGTVASTEMFVTNGGKVSAEYITLGTMGGSIPKAQGGRRGANPVYVYIDKDSTMHANTALYVYDAYEPFRNGIALQPGKGLDFEVNLHNEGTITAKQLVAYGGTITNSGLIKVTKGTTLTRGEVGTPGAPKSRAVLVLKETGTLSDEGAVFVKSEATLRVEEGGVRTTAPITLGSSGSCSFESGATVELYLTSNYLDKLTELTHDVAVLVANKEATSLAAALKETDLGCMWEFDPETALQWKSGNGETSITGKVNAILTIYMQDEEIAENIKDLSDEYKRDVIVKGDSTLSGNNSYSGGTVIDGGKLTVASDTALGTGAVILKNHGTLDLGGKAVSNYISVEGCTLAGAGAYSGNMDVSGDLLLQDATTAAKVVMLGAGKISGAPLTTTELDVQTDGNASISGDLTINDNGTLTLNNGNILEVGGSLTLGNGVKLILNGDYDVSSLVLSSTGTLTLGDVSLVYGDSTVELEKQGNGLVLVSKFKQNKADATTLSNWGIATASRAFVNTVRGQRSNTGCIANGKGTAWVASLGSKHEINGSDIDISGAAVGADMKVGRNSRIGIALGYVEGEVQPAGFSQVDQEGSYVAVYGEHGLKKLSATSCLSMDWVAAYGTTDSEVGGLKWEQDSLQLNSRVNWNKKVNNRLCMSVFGGLEYFANNSDTVDGVKTGSIQNLRGEIGVGARYVAWGTPAVTDGKSGLVLAQGCEKLVLNGEVRYMNDMVRSNPAVRMNGLSGMGENPGRQGIGIEAGATYRIGERWSASANYGFNTMEDSKEHRLNIGAAYTF